MARNPLSEVQFHATFEAPAGHDVARLFTDFLVAKLTTFGVRCREPQEAGDASIVSCTIGQRRFHMSVGELDGQDGEWLISLTSTLSGIRRLFRAKDEAEHRHLVRALHTVLDGDERIGELQWAGTEDQSMRPGERWWVKREQDQ